MQRDSEEGKRFWLHSESGFMPAPQTGFVSPRLQSGFGKLPGRLVTSAREAETSEHNCCVGAQNSTAFLEKVQERQGVLVTKWYNFGS